jgi:hypothetical protein
MRVLSISKLNIVNLTLQGGCPHIQIAGFFFYQERNIFMIYQIISTHNPQDFFNGNEPEDLPEYYETTNEDLTEIVSKCIEGGYVVIIYPKED